MAYVHQLDPVLLPLWGNFGIRWYGLAYLAGFIFAYFYIRWLSQKRGLNWSSEWVGDLVTYGAIGTLMGGRLGYVLFYSPDLLWSFKKEFPFWGVLAVHEGGMASHGGLIGLIVAALLFARRYGVQVPVVLDFMALSAPFGIFWGRIANFINGELFGRVMEKPWPWGVQFPTEMEFWPKYSPEKLLVLEKVVPQVGVSEDQWRQWLHQIGEGFSLRNIYGAIEALIQAARSGQGDVLKALSEVLPVRHPSQLYEAILEGALLFIILFLYVARDRKPGQPAALFLVVYGLFRIFVEFFRQPDAHIGFDGLGLTRGQWLSLVMVAAGVGLMAYWSQSRQTIPGWKRPLHILDEETPIPYIVLGVNL